MVLGQQDLTTGSDYINASHVDVSFLYIDQVTPNIVHQVTMYVFFKHFYFISVVPIRILTLYILLTISYKSYCNTYTLDL